MISKLIFPFFSKITSQNSLFNLLGSNIKLVKAPPNVDLVRYAARKGTRAKALAKKRAFKLSKQGKPEPIPKYLQRKVKATPEFERIRCTDENWLESKPIDNVWNMKLYRGKPYSVVEAISMLRLVHEPAMLNEPNALIYANVELDLKLKKRDRYMEDLNGVLTFPHAFKASKKNRIVVICKTAEDQLKATDAGAIYVGSTSLIKQILAGSVSKEDFDYLICHPDMYKELHSLRGILAKKFPNTHNGLLRLDIDSAVHSFIDGVEYNLKRSSIEPDFGWLDIPFGRLNMKDDNLEENLKHALVAVEKSKPTGTEHLVFMVRVHLLCEKSRDRFKIPHWEYLTHYPKYGIMDLKDEEGETDPILQEESSSTGEMKN